MNQENALSIKAAITSALAFLTALWGWFGWLVIAWAVCMTIDYATGYCAALKNGEWDSKVAREGLWHKGGCIIVVLVASILDAVVGYLLKNIPTLNIPFDYSMFITALVVIWYLLMEIGSITENAGKMGAPVPEFMCRMIKVLKSSLTTAADNMIPDPEKDVDDKNKEEKENES